MIDLYTWKTPNGRKISIMLEEVGLDYEVHPININEGEQQQKHSFVYGLCFAEGWANAKTATHD